MRVGIVTMHAIRNYGSFMQAYGLQRTIEKLGFEVEIVDYAYPNKFHRGHDELLRWLLHQVNYWLKNFLPGVKGWRFNHRYAVCHSRFYRLSKHYPTQDSILRNPPKYDIYVAGSDQIWRPKFTKGDSVFFLDFAHAGGKRISYSSSFGCLSIAGMYIDTYRKFLNKFDAISVREETGVGLVNDISGKIAQRVVDPSLLLTGAEWRSMLVPSRRKKKYVVCYGGVECRFCNELAHRYADARGYDVVRINGKFYDYFRRREHYILDAGPLEWLGFLDGAELVVVGGSFHGTALSILLHKPFVSVLSKDPDHNTRQLNLLEMLNLSQCGISAQNPNEVDLDRIENSLDWVIIEDKISQLRNESIEFLKEHLCIDCNSGRTEDFRY